MNVAIIILLFFNLAVLGLIGGIVEVIFKKQKILIEDTKMLMEGHIVILNALKKLLTK
jgi:hypothetical protein